MSDLRTHPEWRGRKGAARWANHPVCVCGACRGCYVRRMGKVRQARETARVQAQRLSVENLPPSDAKLLEDIRIMWSERVRPLQEAIREAQRAQEGT